MRETTETDRRSRLTAAGEEGFSLMELVIVLLIMGILGSISVGAYLHMRDQGEVSAAELNVREALPAAELYYAHHETYTGMTKAELDSLVAGIHLSANPVIASDGKKFCLESTHNGRSPTAAVEPGHNIHSLVGPGGDVVAGQCPPSL
jgi:prepilin-type N-terminal cleavage/methylation domain-containing protein